MDMRPTTVRVIAPHSQCVGEEMVVDATYGDDVYVVYEGRTLRYRRSQVEVVHVQDLDNVLVVTGAIDGSMWDQLSKALREMFGGWNAVVISGWTGQEGYMSLKFDLWTAAARMAAVVALCEPLGLLVSKPEPKFL